MADFTPSVLYHYTDASGLAGIISSSTLWASSSTSMNDFAEGALGWNLVESRLDEIAADQLDPRRKNVHLLRWALRPKFFLVSFCEKDDLLSQWRAYGGRGGFAIAIDAAQVLDSTNHQAFHCYLERVIYKEEDQQSRVTQAVDDALAAWDPKVVPQMSLVPWHVPLLRAVAAVKQQAFEEEHEWRLVVLPTGLAHSEYMPSVYGHWPNPMYGRHFRTTSDGRLLPYFILQPRSPVKDYADPALPIKGVTIGPSFHQEESEFAAKELLGQYGHSNATVTLSKTTQR